jgi:glycoprotein 3-alpha-L-fucosyltransferase
MTYRQDSDIVHDYGRFIARNLSHTIRDYQAVDFYLSSKDNRSTFNTKIEFKNRKNEILWFVSNCHTRSKRHQIAEALNKSFPIDQYGQCSHINKKANRLSAEDFERTLFEYKFYLAFENANCQDYITEKAFYNALAHGSIPIVFGSNEKNYQSILPPNSFIHIEHFKSLQDLAVELNRVSEDLKIFQSYHRWRVNYRLIVWPSNYYINDRFCDLCIKLYEDENQKSYENFAQWLNKCK